MDYEDGHYEFRIVGETEFEHNFLSSLDVYEFKKVKMCDESFQIIAKLKNKNNGTKNNKRDRS